jgi:sec-independent protein translocase protein TatA
MPIGPKELMLILLIVIILFGAGRIGKIAAELGQGIREFKRGISNSNTEDVVETESENS